MPRSTTTPTPPTTDGGPPRWSVYVVEGRTGQLYTGIATDVERRITEHNTSPRGSRWCRANRPVTLVWQQPAGSRSEASKLEARIKKLSRTKKLELIATGLSPEGGCR